MLSYPRGEKGGVRVEAVEKLAPQLPDDTGPTARRRSSSSARPTARRSPGRSCWRRLRRRRWRRRRRGRASGGSQAAGLTRPRALFYPPKNPRLCAAPIPRQAAHCNGHGPAARGARCYLPRTIYTRNLSGIIAPAVPARRPSRRSPALAQVVARAKIGACWRGRTVGGSTRLFAHRVYGPVRRAGPAQISLHKPPSPRCKKAMRRPITAVARQVGAPRGRRRDHRP